MKRITTKSVGNNYVEIEEDIVLDDTAKTRTVFRPAMHPEGIRGEIIRFKKGPDGSFEEPVPINFNSIHENEGIKITLPTDAVNVLFQRLKELRKLLEEKGVHYGTHEFTIVDENSLVINDHTKAKAIEQLINSNYEEDVWEVLNREKPTIASRLANVKIHEDRKGALDIFCNMLNEDLPEDEWQKFFENNQWIFGYGLRYQFLNVIQSQPNYGGTTVTGRGGQRGDFLTASSALTKYTCLVEIKKPSTTLLQNNAYRNGVWAISSELSGAISQIQVNCAQWEMSGSKNEENREKLGELVTVSPKGIVVVGSTSELDLWSKRNSFERYRRELHNPEIITYDELFERARFIVEGELYEPHTLKDDDIPF